MEATGPVKKVWLIFTEPCYETLIVGKKMDIQCMKLAFSEVLSYAIVVLAPIAKIPQITKVVSSKSVEGLSFVSFLVDVLAFFIIDCGLYIHMLILLLLFITSESIWRDDLHSHSKYHYFSFVLYFQ